MGCPERLAEAVFCPPKSGRTIRGMPQPAPAAWAAELPRRISESAPAAETASPRAPATPSMCVCPYWLPAVPAECCFLQHPACGSGRKGFCLRDQPERSAALKSGIGFIRAVFRLPSGRAPRKAEKGIHPAAAFLFIGGIDARDGVYALPGGVRQCRDGEFVFSVKALFRFLR